MWKERGKIYQRERESVCVWEEDSRERESVGGWMESRKSYFPVAVDGKK